MIKKWDAVLIILLMVLSFIPEGIFLFGNDSASGQRTYAEITRDGQVYKTVPLSGHSGEDRFTVQTEDGGYNIVVIQEDRIGIAEADCPDKICIHEGFISRPGESVICLPHKVMVEVKAEGDAEPDIIPAR